MLSKRRNKTTASKFFARALEVNGLPRKIVIDRSGANTAGTNAISRILRSFGCWIPIEMVRIKYLNKTVEQDHRSIKKCIRPMPGFKSFTSASATLEGIEVANIIRKSQLTPGLCPLYSLQFWPRKRTRTMTSFTRCQTLRHNPACIIAVTHDEKILDRFDRLTHLGDGRLTDD